MRLAYQGEPGAYSEAAALQYGGAHAETLPCKTFDEVFEAVSRKKATHGVVPLENSIGGTIHRNYDLLLEHELPIESVSRNDPARWSARTQGNHLVHLPAPPGWEPGRGTQPPYAPGDLVTVTVTSASANYALGAAPSAVPATIPIWSLPFID